MQTKVNRPKIVKETSSHSTRSSKNVSNNIGKYFLLLMQKHFPNNHKYQRIFSKNNVKISYSCVACIKSIINLHNKEVITEKKTQPINCIGINKLDCPFPTNAKLQT